MKWINEAVEKDICIKTAIKKIDDTLRSVDKCHKPYVYKEIIRYSFSLRLDRKIK